SSRLAAVINPLIRCLAVDKIHPRRRRVTHVIFGCIGWRLGIDCLPFNRTSVSSHETETD
ncbi:MAG: hypothetical protein QF920_09510, partial [Verrucomicrobiota bacterium]|nr:hypothetical protein [Verrucomicrobiota bacterium]